MNNRNVITLAKFLSRYLGVNGEFTKYLTHDDIKYMFPSIKRSSFSYIDEHKGAVECGFILLVNDGRKTIPYYAPVVNQEQSVVIEEEKKEDNKKKNIDYANMRIFELRELLNVKFNGYHTSRMARRELEDRGVVLRKKYNREEFKKWRKDYERD